MGARFVCNIEEIAEKLAVDADYLKRRIALEVLSELLATTPVDTGRARAGWGVRAERPGSDAPAKGQKSYTPKQAFVPKGANVICIYNNVEYILKLNDGHSRQAPSMFVEKAIDKVLSSYA